MDKTQIASSSSIERLMRKFVVHEEVFVLLKPGDPWKKCKIKSVYHKVINNMFHSIVKVILDEPESRSITVEKFHVARIENHGLDLKVSKRVIAGISEDKMISGIIGQEPCDENQYRYMILLDDCSVRYFEPGQIYPIVYQSCIPWKDSIVVGKRKQYHDAELTTFFKEYPRRHLIRANEGLKLNIFRDDVLVSAIVKEIDCDTIKVQYEDMTVDSVYRGGSRFVKRCYIASKMLANVPIERLYNQLVKNIKEYHDAGRQAINEVHLPMRFSEDFDCKLKVCGPQTARKSTSRRSTPPKVKVPLVDDSVPDDRHTFPDLQELMKNPESIHKCDPSCLEHSEKRTEKNVASILDEFRNVADLKVPLKLGWRRLMVKSTIRNKTTKPYIYIAPCGKIISQIHNIKRYIQYTRSKLDVDYFTFDRDINLNRAIEDREAFYFNKNIAIDKTTGKPLENKEIGLINQFNEDRLPLDFEYRNERFPHPVLAAKGFSFNEDFKSGCDCDDDCSSRATCACHILNEQAAGSNAHNKGVVDLKCQYKDKRLVQQVSTGLFECNSYCSCSSKCPNRVVQNGIRLRLQVRKTLEKGWGVFTLDDAPKGAFICTYSAELLDDADQYGNCDMYYADLDYITIVEYQKQALEDDKSDEGVDTEHDNGEDNESNHQPSSKSKKRPLSEESQHESSSEDGRADSFMPIESRYPRRSKNRIEDQSSQNRSVSFKRIHDILNESQDYTLDARMQGNIGRFFNHSCDPNAFVQNVFIESHDLRFPVVSFFAKRALKADDEITWHYNYKIDSIEGRQIPCNCGAPNCAGRIL